MRLLLKGMVILVIGLVVVGFWQDWFSVSRSPNADPDSHKANINVSVDKDKMKSDIKKAKEVVKEEVGKLKSKAKPAETKQNGS